ncbi:MAG: hypothetical protein JOZ09_15755 [Pseudonocardiales bacterium]|nr:hypothetical protein [Pseudonocardiales bacterium]
MRYIHTILHRAFKDAIRWGRLARNPADAADPPHASAENKAAMKTLTAERWAPSSSTSRRTACMPRSC